MIHNIVENFDTWMTAQPKWKQFFALFGLISAMLLLAGAVLFVVASIFIFTVKMMITVSMWYSVLLVAEIIALFAGFIAWTIISD